MQLDDTIVAISTPAGRGGIGIVRLSGPEARTMAAPLLKLRSELQPNRASFGELVEPAGGQRIDEVVVTYFARPHSYTTEDVVEISAHGAPVVLRHIVELCLARGARLAEPGEFTMRAFLHGRLDLTQAEAVRDLIDSQTLHQARVAAQQLGGALSHRAAPVKATLVELIAALEAGIDFAEDDVSVLPARTVLDRIEQIAAPLRELARSFAYGKLVHEGLTLAIVGRPNVGKSSLFNRLVERERAIVTASPGTTRDLVSETVALGGIPVRLVDTAGIREALDEAESIGIHKSLEALADADLVLIVLDASQPHAPEDDDLLRDIGARPAIVVLNKSDLRTGPMKTPFMETPFKMEAPGFSPAGSEPHREGALAPDTAEHPIARKSDRPWLRTSALTGAGIERLRAQIIDMAGGGAEHESAVLTNLRQQQAVTAAIEALSAATRAAESNTPHEMLLLDLYNALRALDELTGATTTDDILNLIFSTFCIGK